MAKLQQQPQILVKRKKGERDENYTLLNQSMNRTEIILWLVLGYIFALIRFTHLHRLDIHQLQFALVTTVNLHAVHLQLLSIVNYTTTTYYTLSVDSSTQQRSPSR